MDILTAAPSTPLLMDAARCGDVNAVKLLLLRGARFDKNETNNMLKTILKDLNDEVDRIRLSTTTCTERPRKDVESDITNNRAVCRAFKSWNERLGRCKDKEEWCGIQKNTDVLLQFALKGCKKTQLSPCVKLTYTKQQAVDVLVECCAAGNVRRASELVMIVGADHENSAGSTPLMTAVYYANVTTTALLLLSGAQTNYMNKGGENAMSVLEKRLKHCANERRYREEKKRKGREAEHLLAPRQFLKLEMDDGSLGQLVARLTTIEDMLSSWDTEEFEFNKTLELIWETVAPKKRPPSLVEPAFLSRRAPRNSLE